MKIILGNNQCKKSHSLWPSPQRWTLMQWQNWLFPCRVPQNYALSVCIAEGTQQKRSKTMPRPPLGVTWSSAIILWKRIPPSGRWQKNFWQSPMTACLGSRWRWPSASILYTAKSCKPSSRNTKGKAITESKSVSLHRVNVGIKNRKGILMQYKTKADLDRSIDELKNYQERFHDSIYTLTNPELISHWK